MPLAVLLGATVLPLSVSACGGNDSSGAAKTVTVTAVAASSHSTAAQAKGKVVKVKLGERGSTYFVRPAQKTVRPGRVTFAVTNTGKLYHEFIVYTNTAGVAPGKIPVKAGEANLVEKSIVGEAPYATPPIVPSDKKRGDSDHHIRDGGWGAELTANLKAGNYILLCNLAGHYTGAKQYSAFTVK